MSIPPGAENHREEGSLRLPMDIQVLSFLPHMHLRAKPAATALSAPAASRGRCSTFRATTSTGNCSIAIAEPQARLARRHDQIHRLVRQQPNNPANPDPTQTVRWGKQTADEMHLGYVEYFVPGLAPGEPLPTFSIPR